MSAVVQGTLTSRAPKYSIILDLDRKVRDMELPSYAQGQPPQGKGLAETMSHFMPTNYRELSQLSSPHFPLPCSKHKVNSSKLNLSATYLNSPQLCSISTDVSLRMRFPVIHWIPSRVNTHHLFWQVIVVLAILWRLSSFSLRCSLRRLQGIGCFGHMHFRLQYVPFFLFFLG